MIVCGNDGPCIRLQRVFKHFSGMNRGLINRSKKCFKGNESVLDVQKQATEMFLFFLRQMVRQKFYDEVRIAHQIVAFFNASGKDASSHG